MVIKWETISDRNDGVNKCAEGPFELIAENNQPKVKKEQLRLFEWWTKIIVLHKEIEITVTYR